MLVRNETELKRAMALDTEHERVEFKEAGGKSFSRHDIAEYCIALANEGGGSLVLGITDKKPRRRPGTDIEQNLDDTKMVLFDWLRLKLKAYEIKGSGKRVVSVVAPSRPIGRPLHYRGRYLMRAGSGLRPMEIDEIKRILGEGDVDFTANVIERATSDAFDPAHVERFRQGRIRREERNQMPRAAANIQSISVAELLETAGLTSEGLPTYAGLLMVGKKRAIFQHLPHAEIIFEYRNSEGILMQQREALRDGFIAGADEIWNLVNARNDNQPYQEGLFKYPLKTFDEATIREALCNAVCHRDYRDHGSVFVRQYPQSLEVESPGGFVEGVNLSNLLTQSKHRNRRLAEAMEACGLVERSGQGIDLMYEQCVIHSRPLPDWSKSDDVRVIVNVRGEITDAKVVRFFERLSADTLKNFTGEDFWVVDLVRRKQPLSDAHRERAKGLIRLGVLERAGPGFRLSQKHLEALEGPPSRADAIPATHLSVLNQVRARGALGASASELMELTGFTRDQVRGILTSRKEAGDVHTRGRGPGARWYAGSAK